MSSSVNRRIYRAAEADEDVFVVGETVRRYIPADGSVATVTDLLDGARRRAESIIAAAEADAAAIVARAEMAAEQVRQAGYEAGQAGGAALAADNAAEYLDVIRRAASEGLAIRDAMIDEAMPAIARAVAMACRRVVGAAFAADPGLTADACAAAVRAASGQQIISSRVSPEAADEVRTVLADVAQYIRPDTGVELGGCVIDLRNGTIDATLDARLSLMELALLSAGGGAE